MKQLFKNTDDALCSGFKNRGRCHLLGSIDSLYSPLFIDRLRNLKPYGVAACSVIDPHRFIIYLHYAVKHIELLEVSIVGYVDLAHHAEVFDGKNR